MSYGVVQEYFTSNWPLSGSREPTGVIGTTFNGIIYISMPFLFALFTKRWARWRQAAALCGSILTCASFLLSSLSTTAWHLVATQGVLAPLGCALVFSPVTLSLGEWFSSNQGDSGKSNRALAYGVTLSCKNVVGSACPFLFRALLDSYGFRAAARVWAAVAAATCIPAIFMIPTHPHILEQSRLLSSSSTGAEPPRSRRIPWHFLRHRTIYIYSAAILLQSAGYGIPQTYLSTYAHDVAGLSQASATLLLTVFNLPGIASSSFFGFLCDSRRLRLSAATVTAIPAAGSALAAFLFWGLAWRGSMALLVLFSATFGFFAGGYSATWGSVLNELEGEARDGNEAVDTGMLYGLLNGARGVGYVGGGLVGLPLLKAGGQASLGTLGYGTTYGPLIVFTGLSSVLGGWAVLWRWHKMVAFL
jgi:predicted MFS family arabinose efflux permease